MKKMLFKILFIVLIFLGLNGCYTIIWSPDSEFPTQDNSDNSTIYYGDTYYGPYFIYYDTPWWYDYAPPVVSRPETKTREDNSDIGRLRDSGGDRGTAGRIPDVQPPSRSENSSDTSSSSDKSSGNSGSSSSGSTVRNSSSSGSGNTSGKDNSSGSGTVRNNNGGRSSGGRK